MAKRDIKILQGGYDAFGRGDIDAVRATWDSRIQWHEPPTLPWGGRHSGANAIIDRVFGPALGSIQNFKVKADEFLSDADTVLVLGTFTGKVGSRSLKAPFAHVWKVRDGKVVRFQNYTDTAAFNEALGGSGNRRRGYPRGG